MKTIKRLNKTSVLRALISLLLAILMWAFALTNTDPTITYSVNNVSLSYINLREGLIVDNPLKTVDIKIYGRTLQLAKLKKSDISATVDMSSVTSEGMFTLKVNISGLPDNVDVTDISYQYVAVTVSNFIKQEYSYTIERTGTLPEGYSILECNYDAEMVHISGSQSIVSSIDTIKGTLVLNSETSNFSQRIVLKAYDAEGAEITGIELLPSSVSANVVIGFEKSVPVEVTTKNSLSEELSLNYITVYPQTVKISGAVSILSDISAIYTQEVDLAEIGSTGVYEVNLNVPAGVSLSGGGSVNVTVNVTKLSTAEFQFESLQIRNLAAGLKCDLTEVGTVSLTIAGEESVVAAISQADIVIYIDLTGLTEGSHDVLLQYVLPSGVKLAKLSQNYVKVTLAKK